MRSRCLSLLALTAVLTGTAALAADAPKARFSDAASFVGAPKLPLTLSMILAGGGPKNFSTGTLVGVLAGDKAKAEVDKLTKQYSAEDVKSFLTVFDYVVNDAVRIVTDKKIALPAEPAPNPSDGKALSASLYKAGVDGDGHFDVEYMLDALVSHPIHNQVMDDIDKKFGRKADANYHIILLQAMSDLKSVYGI